MATSSPHEEELADLGRFRKGEHWTAENVRTILQWIHVSAINLDILQEATIYYKRVLRRNTILSLILSTLASTTSLSQYSLNADTHAILVALLKGLFTFMSGIVAVSAGYIKVYQIQEKLEKAIKLQQEWMAFGSVLSSELQLPLHLRKDALYIIMKYKDVYNDLIKQQVDISRRIMEIVALRNGVEPQALSMSELFERLLDTEATRVGIVIAAAPPTPARRMVFSLHQHAAAAAGSSAGSSSVQPAQAHVVHQAASRNLLRLPPVVSLVSPFAAAPASAVHSQRQKVSQMVMGMFRRQSSFTAPLSAGTGTRVGGEDFNSRSSSLAEDAEASDDASDTQEIELDVGVRAAAPKTS